MSIMDELDWKLDDGYGSTGDSGTSSTGLLFAVNSCIFASPGESIT